MSKPTVSVCIVTCNQRDFIGTCLRSVMEQDVEATLSVLVGDDASNDGTSDIVAHISHDYPGRIQHILRKPRLGVFANMRDLMGRADGEYVASVDGDDYWLPGKLARQLAFLLAHPDCAAVYTNAITLDEQDNRIGLFNDVGDERFDLPAMLRRGNFLNSSSVLFRSVGRQALLDVLEPQIDYRVHLWRARHGWLAHIGEPLTAYRVNTQGSMVANMNDHVRELYWQAILSVPRNQITDDDYAHGIADFLRRVALRALRTRRWSLLREWLPRVYAASPCGIVRTTALTFASLARIISKQIVNSIRNMFVKNGSKILYLR